MDLLFITALSWIFLHTAGSGPEPCCVKKKVGGVLYNLIHEEDTSAYDCHTNCVYLKDDESGQRFCFSAGNLDSVCESIHSTESEETTESTEATQSKESTEPTQSNKATETREPTESKESTKTTQSRETTESTDTTETTKPFDIVFSENPLNDTIEGILIAGGSVGRYNATNVEIFLPSTKSSKTCTRISITGGRGSATLNTIAKEPVICGGNPAVFPSQIPTTCQVFRGRQWSNYADLLTNRIGHTTWVTPDGLLLIGGYSGPKTTELVPSGGGQSVKSFDLKKDTNLVCSISFEDSIVITGGVWSLDAVTRYNSQGHVEDLPALNQGRYWHGCGSYNQPDGTVVLIVAGGNSGGFGSIILLDSTEKLLLTDTGTPIWTETKPLPRGLFLMASVSTKNRIYILGGEMQDFSPRAEILEYVDGEEWKLVGNLQQELGGHAATAIDSDLIQFC